MLGWWASACQRGISIMHYKSRQTRWEKASQIFMLYFNALRIVRNLCNQGNNHRSGSTYKKPPGSCGGDWEGYEIEKKGNKVFQRVMRYIFLSFWRYWISLPENLSMPQQEKQLEANLNKHRTWLKTHPEEPLRVTACLHWLFLPDRKRLKKKFHHNFFS